MQFCGRVNPLLSRPRAQIKTQLHKRRNKQKYAVHLQVKAEIKGLKPLASKNGHEVLKFQADKFEKVKPMNKIQPTKTDSRRN